MLLISHVVKEHLTQNHPSRFYQSQWRLEDLGWELVPPERLTGWDGMLGWFLRYIEERAGLLDIGGVRNWHRAAVRAMEES